MGLRDQLVGELLADGYQLEKGSETIWQKNHRAAYIMVFDEGTDQESGKIVHEARQLNG